MKYENIMIIDDSGTSRLIIKKCFYIAGFSEASYIEAENGLDALSLLEENQVDLIVTDLNMPKMDGHNLIKKLRNKDKTKNLDIIVITSLVNDFSESEIEEMKLLGVIKKPISPDKLLQIFGELS